MMMIHGHKNPWFPLPVVRSDCCFKPAQTFEPICISSVIRQQPDNNYPIASYNSSLRSRAICSTDCRGNKMRLTTVNISGLTLWDECCCGFRPLWGLIEALSAGWSDSLAIWSLGHMSMTSALSAMISWEITHHHHHQECALINCERRGKCANWQPESVN